MKLKEKYRLEHYADCILTQYFEDSDNICRMKFIDYIVEMDNADDISYLIDYIYNNHPSIYKCLYPIILEYNLNGTENLIDSYSEDEDTYESDSEEDEYTYEEALDEKISNMTLLEVICSSVKYWWNTKRK